MKPEFIDLKREWKDSLTEDYQPTFEIWLQFRLHAERAVNDILLNSITEDRASIAIEQVQKKFMRWAEYKEIKPPLGIEVLAYSKDWIDEDYNPKGIRVGFQNDSEDDDGYFVSALWNNTKDYYGTDEKSKPEKWKSIYP